MNFKTLTLSLTMAFVFSATAQEKPKKVKAAKAALAANAEATEPKKGSEYQFQVPAGKFAVQPSIIYTSNTLKTKGIDLKIDVTSLSEDIDFQYGLSNAVSLGFAISNSTGSSKFTPSSIDLGGGPIAFPEQKSSGLEDPDFYVNVRMPLGMGELRYGAHLTYSVEKQKTTGNKSNAASGSNTLTPFVGYEISSANCTYGLRTIYDLVKTDQKSVTDGVSSSSSGEERFATALFYEHSLNPSIIGMSLEVAAIKEAKAADGSQSQAPMTIGLARAYGRFEMNPSFALVARGAIGQGIAIDNANMKSLDNWTADIGGRFTF